MPRAGSALIAALVAGAGASTFDAPAPPVLDRVFTVRAGHERVRLSDASAHTR